MRSVAKLQEVSVALKGTLDFIVNLFRIAKRILYGPGILSDGGAATIGVAAPASLCRGELEASLLKRGHHDLFGSGVVEHDG